MSEPSKRRREKRKKQRADYMRRKHLGIPLPVSKKYGKRKRTIAYKEIEVISEVRVMTFRDQLINIIKRIWKVIRG